ncbi:hypothetical protein KC19_9G052200 [Ceratodon purpureus]|uniref:Uncharacterized protein n=1 Tax=Ceratodon purpureus TaxID=3225 RepID=A0A8T0GSE9_CERPU|nr:hypothetical protein KC19_9G052200 [Ceratodon purpureus]
MKSPKIQNPLRTTHDIHPLQNTEAEAKGKGKGREKATQQSTRRHHLAHFNLWLPQHIASLSRYAQFPTICPTILHAFFPTFFHTILHAIFHAIFLAIFLQFLLQRFGWG